jgi:hypothetical protein
MSWRTHFPGTHRDLVACPGVPKIVPLLLRTAGGEAISAVFEASGLRDLSDHFTYFPTGRYFSRTHVLDEVGRKGRIRGKSIL